MPSSQLSPKIFACSQSLELAEKIAKEYGVELGKVTTTHFSDGEFQPAFEESIRGRRIFIIGSTFPTADNLMEMLLMIDAAKRASAKKGDSGVRDTEASRQNPSGLSGDTKPRASSRRESEGRRHMNSGSKGADGLARRTSDMRISDGGGRRVARESSALASAGDRISRGASSRRLSGAGLKSSVPTDSDPIRRVRDSKSRT